MRNSTNGTIAHIFHLWRWVPSPVSIVATSIQSLVVTAAPTATRTARSTSQQIFGRAISWLSSHKLLRIEALVALLATILSISSYVWYASRGLTLAYGDAISHMSIAYHVFASRSPGLAQLGSVWPPLNHMFMLPFVWNEILYRSGLGGSIPSMVAYVVAIVYMYRSGSLIFGSRNSGIVAALVLALNPSVLYMQATPMSEMDLICFAVVAVYYACRWAHTLAAPDLTKCAAAVAAGTLIRYDGWALALALLAILILIAWRKRNRVFAESSALLYSTLGFAGCAAWFIYEQVIFSNALDFLTGPYSAKSQEHNIQNAGGLQTYHNPLLSLHVYTQVMIDAAGAPLIAAAVIGLVWWLWNTRQAISSWPVYAVLVPFAFNWLSLVLGITTIVTPEVPNGGSSTYFNVRYGMMMLPAVALFIAALVSSKRFLMPAFLALIIVYCGGTLFLGTPYALQDPLHGANAHGRQLQTAEAEWLVAHYSGGAILASNGSFTPMMYYTDLPSNTFITENDGQIFQAAVANPQQNAEWVIVDTHNNNFDAVWSALHTRAHWSQHYVLRKTFGSVELFQLISPMSSRSTVSISPMYSSRFAYWARYHFPVRRQHAY